MRLEISENSFVPRKVELDKYPDPEIIERFRRTEIKFAIQKDGELTELSRQFLEEMGFELSANSVRGRRLVDVSTDGRIGFVFGKNKAIAEKVAGGSVDMAILGMDRVFEDGIEDRVELVKRYDSVRWPIIIATRIESEIDDISQIRRIASQYPRISRKFFDRMGMSGVEIVPSMGGTEVYRYLEEEQGVDGIIDMTVSGQSLRDNLLVAWDPPITHVYPVLIARQGFDVQRALSGYFNRRRVNA